MTPVPVTPRDLELQGGAMRYDASLVSNPDASLFDPASAHLEANAVAHGGRQAAWFVRGGFGEGVLRHYKRGGLMSRLSRDRYFWAGSGATRSFAEFDLLRYMYERRLPVPRPLAAAYWRRGATYSAAILVQRIAQVQPLARVLASGHQAEVAKAIFLMHEAGVWHADLNAYNILLDERGKAWLIDFDKGRRQVPLSMARRQSNLLRLRRSLIKLAGDEGLIWWEELEHTYGSIARAKGHL